MRIETIAPAARSVLLAVNPKAGARSGRPLVDRLVELLERRQFRVEVHSDIQRLKSAAAAQPADSLRAVVAAGGDGTVSLVANSLPPEVPIAILPLGTENLLAKYLGIRSDPLSVCESIVDGRTTRLDAGLAGERLFLLMAGCGFDAAVVERLHQQRTGHIRHLSYVKPILQTIRSYSYPPLKIYCQPAPNLGPQRPSLTGGGQLGGERLPDDGVPGECEVIEARWAFVVNLPRYACGLSLAPEASGHDGLLDVCTFRRGSLLSGLRYLGGVILGRHAMGRECRIVRTPWVRISSPEQVPVQMDGDPGGYLPLEFRCAARRLRVFVSRSWWAGSGGWPSGVPEGQLRTSKG
ncbi:MAG: protein BmrU [Pirellulaceae bacterium]|nr:protein BmrU [Pirellulaceae bacterium]